MPHETVQRGHPVPDEVELGILAYQGFEVLPRRKIVAHVHERDGVIVLLFRSLELIGDVAQVLVAGIEMNGCAIGELRARAANYLFKAHFRTVVFVRLHRLEAGFILLHSLGEPGIVGNLHRLA